MRKADNFDFKRNQFKKKFFYFLFAESLTIQIKLVHIYLE